jgi:hypothetical protein
LGNPRFQILLEIFLRLEVGRDDDDWPRWKNILQQRGEKRVRRRANSGTRQRSAIFQSPGEGLHSGSSRNISEQFACRCGW